LERAEDWSLGGGSFPVLFVEFPPCIFNAGDEEEEEDCIEVKMNGYLDEESVLD